MSFETKRGYRVTLQGKDIIISCPTETEAKQVYDSLEVNVLIGKLEKWGLIKRYERYPH